MLLLELVKISRVIRHYFKEHSASPYLKNNMNMITTVTAPISLICPNYFVLSCGKYDRIVESLTNVGKQAKQLHMPKHPGNAAARQLSALRG